MRTITLAVFVALLLPALAGAQTGESRSAHPCSASVFLTYAKKVYSRDRIERKALRRVDRMRSCLRPWAVRFQRKLGRARWERLNPWLAAWRAVPAWLKAALRNLRGCETRGMPYPENYQAATGNGYYGAYQILPGTWSRMGGTGLPSDASPTQQDVRVARFYPTHRSEWACSG